MAEEKKFFSRRWPYLTSLYNWSPFGWRQYADQPGYDQSSRMATLTRFPTPYADPNVDPRYSVYQPAPVYNKTRKPSRRLGWHSFGSGRSYTFDGRAPSELDSVADEPPGYKRKHSRAGLITLGLFIAFALLIALITIVVIFTHITTKEKSESTCEVFRSNATLRNYNISSALAEPEFREEFCRQLIQMYTNHQWSRVGFCSCNVRAVKYRQQDVHVAFLIEHKINTAEMNESSIASLAAQLHDILHIKTAQPLMLGYELKGVSSFVYSDKETGKSIAGISNRPISIDTGGDVPLIITDASGRQPESTGTTHFPILLDLPTFAPAATDDPSVWHPATDLTRSWQPATDAPSIWQPATDAPSIWQPATDAPSIWQPATDAPSIWQPATDAPSIWQPATDAPSIWQPGTDAPSIWQPGTDAPSIWQPGTDAPSIWQSATDAPSVWHPATDAPSVWKPATDAPRLWLPATDSPNVWRSATQTPFIPTFFTSRPQIWLGPQPRETTPTPDVGTVFWPDYWRTQAATERPIWYGPRTHQSQTIRPSTDQPITHLPVLTESPFFSPSMRPDIPGRWPAWQDRISPQQITPVPSPILPAIHPTFITKGDVASTTQRPAWETSKPSFPIITPRPSPVSITPSRITTTTTARPWRPFIKLKPVSPVDIVPITPQPPSPGVSVAGINLPVWFDSIFNPTDAPTPPSTQIPLVVPVDAGPGIPTGGINTGAGIGTAGIILPDWFNSVLVTQSPPLTQPEPQIVPPGSVTQPMNNLLSFLRNTSAFQTTNPLDPFLPSQTGSVGGAIGDPFGIGGIGTGTGGFEQFGLGPGGIGQFLPGLGAGAGSMGGFEPGMGTGAGGIGAIEPGFGTFGGTGGGGISGFEPGFGGGAGGIGGFEPGLGMGGGVGTGLSGLGAGIGGLGGFEPGLGTGAGGIGGFEPGFGTAGGAGTGLDVFGTGMGIIGGLEPGLGAGAGGTGFFEPGLIAGGSGLGGFGAGMGGMGAFDPGLGMGNVAGLGPSGSLPTWFNALFPSSTNPVTAEQSPVNPRRVRRAGEPPAFALNSTSNTMPLWYKRMFPPRINSTSQPTSSGKVIAKPVPPPRSRSPFHPNPMTIPRHPSIAKSPAHVAGLHPARLSRPSMPATQFSPITPLQSFTPAGQHPQTFPSQYRPTPTYLRPPTIPRQFGRVPPRPTPTSATRPTPTSATRPTPTSATRPTPTNATRPQTPTKLVVTAQPTMVTDPPEPPDLLSYIHSPGFNSFSNPIMDLNSLSYAINLAGIGAFDPAASIPIGPAGTGTQMKPVELGTVVSTLPIRRPPWVGVDIPQNNGNISLFDVSKKPSIPFDVPLLGGSAPGSSKSLFAGIFPMGTNSGLGGSSSINLNAILGGSPLGGNSVLGGSPLGVNGVLGGSSLGGNGVLGGSHLGGNGVLGGLTLGTNGALGQGGTQAPPSDVWPIQHGPLVAVGSPHVLAKIRATEMAASVANVPVWFVHFFPHLVT